jgi:Zn-dependent hydrolases, including glyoxylases
MLVDSPYFPDELEALPALARETGFEVEALLATHGDFDHLLGRLAFPDLALGVGATTSARLRAEPGTAQRELRDADAEHYVRRERPLSLGATEELPVPAASSSAARSSSCTPRAATPPTGWPSWPATWASCSAATTSRAWRSR